MATIWDVAKLAGVSKSTVSRVMNNGSVSPKAKEAVLVAIEKLNYEPSVFAKSIRTQKSMTIAIMIPNASNLFYMEMFKSIEKIAYENGYMVILCDTNKSPENEINYAKKLISRRIDGLVYCAFEMAPITQQFFVNLSHEMPLVFLDNAFRNIDDDISIVATDGYLSSRNAVKFLYNKGYRNIAYINFPKNVRVTLHRFEGYKKGLEDCGLPYYAEHVYFPNPENIFSNQDIGYEGTKKLTHSHNIDSIMVASDSIAIGSLRYLKDNNFRVPEDISVIGFDNNEICEIVQPMLTTISQPIKEIGTVAAKILFDKINGENKISDRVFFDGELIQRNSTK